MRILGPEPDLPDILNEVFFQVLKSVKNLKDETALKAWITRVAGLTARKVIDKRKRSRWLSFSSNEYLANVEHMECPQETKELILEVEAVLDKMPTKERIIFCLKFIDGMTLDELANACNVSRATIKRRVSKCKIRFRALASRHKLLAEELDLSPRWRVQ